MGLGTKHGQERRMLQVPPAYELQRRQKHELTQDLRPR